MRSLPQRWARQYAYTTGPKSGLPSKIAPASISLQGIQPGTGSRIAAEEMNELLAVMQEHVENTRFAGLRAWQELASGFNSPAAIVQHPLTGEVWISTPTEERRTTGGPIEHIAQAATQFSGASDRAACVRRDTAGNGSIVIFGTSATGVRAAYTAAGSPTVLAVTSLANAATPTGMRDCVYDEVGACVIGFTTGAAAAQRIVRFPDAAVVISFATTAPTFANMNSANESKRILASGGGTTLLVYGGIPNFVAYRSTDAGVTFAVSTAPPGNTSLWVQGLFYIEDFIGLGPRFVCATSSTSDGRRLHHTTDGTVWTTITPPTFVQNNVAVDATAIIIGSSVIYADRGGPVGTVWDVARNTVTAHRFLVSNAEKLWLVNGRLHAQRSTANTHHVSGQLVAPLGPTLGRMSD